MRSLHKTPAYRVYFQKHASEILERAAARYFISFGNNLLTPRSNEAGVIIFMLTEECYRSPSVSYHKAWCAAARGGSVPLMELFEHFPSLSKTIANKDSAMAGVAGAVLYLFSFRTTSRTILNKLMHPVVPVFSRTKEAAFGGQTSLCSALMKRFNVEKNISAWNSVLREAASGGHVQLIEMALQNGATDVQKYHLLALSLCV